MRSCSMASLRPCILRRLATLQLRDCRNGRGFFAAIHRGNGDGAGLASWHGSCCMPGRRYEAMTRHKCALPVLMLSLAIGILVSPTLSRADTAWEKAGRGLASMTTPFLEIPGNIVETTDRHGALAGWTNGLARGLGMAIVRPPIGFYELVTAPIAAPK